MNRNKIIILPKNVIKYFSIHNNSCNLKFILKELLENSCDANSTRIIIKIHIQKKYIQIIDNGYGVDKNDLHKMGLQHHTSKISKLTDLTNIKLYGFKGESLYLIKSICDLDISSKTQDQDHSWCISFTQSSNFYTIEPTDPINGTCVTAKNLVDLNNHYNITSLYKIFKCIALSHFDKHFILYKNSYEIFNFPRCNDHSSKIARIKKILKNKYLTNSIDINYTDYDIKASGFLTFTVNNKKTFLFRYLFMNKRFLKIDMLDEIFTNIIKDTKKKITIGYCIYLETKFNLFNMNLDVNKINMTFKNKTIFYSFFYNLINLYITNYIFNQNLEEKNHKQPQIECDDDFYTVNNALSHNMIFNHTNKILTILNNTLIIFQIDNKCYTTQLNILREKLIFKKCIKEFLIQNKLSSKKIDDIACYNITEPQVIISYNNFFLLYGFNLKNNNNIILLGAVPEVLYNFFINWDKLLNDLSSYFSKSMAIYLSYNRIDISVIRIFINNIHSKTPCYKFETDILYNELIIIKYTEKKWFTQNCFEIN